MNEVKDGRLLNAGQVISVDGQDFEVVTVSAQELDGKLVNFRYELALKSEIDNLREQNKIQQDIEEQAIKDMHEEKSQEHLAATPPATPEDEPQTLLPK